MDKFNDGTSYQHILSHFIEDNVQLSKNFSGLRGADFEKYVILNFIAQLEARIENLENELTKISSRG